MTAQGDVPEIGSAEPCREVRAELTHYFQCLRAAHAKAASRGPVANFQRNLAGHDFRIQSVGESFSAALTQAFDHLPHLHGCETSRFEILAWDEAASGISLPDPPWSWPQGCANFRFALPPGGEAFRIHHSQEEATFYMYSAEADQVLLWCKNAAKLPTYFYASPCVMAIQWWQQGRNLQIVHAGCVGKNGNAVLLVGPSGSGKSTTSLLCALDGMDYVSDDLCLLRPGAVPEAICLYNSGKLNRKHLQNFAALASAAIDPGPDREDKPVIFLHREFAGRVALHLPIKAIIAPHVSARMQTVPTPMSAADALKALAPSTIFQRPPYDAGAFCELAGLVRSLPCYRLELGAATAEIPAAVRSVLEHIN